MTMFTVMGEDGYAQLFLTDYKYTYVWPNHGDAKYKHL